ncbi:MAG: DUF6017 domain-containing protein [Oscillospiraceae bacterium]|nr:DUF6017 domain-containing protein [Oscillospiraceae bacterium]
MMNSEKASGLWAFIFLLIQYFKLKELKAMTKQYQGSFRTKQIPFTQIPNTLIRDKNISLKAKGLYMIIQSYITIPNFILYKKYLIKQCVEGVKAFDSAWNELKKTGYLKQYKYRNVEDSGFTYEYELLDVPVIDDDDDNPSSYFDNNIVDPQNGGVDLDPHFVGVQNVDLQNGGDINNININNTESINTILSNHNDMIRKDTISEKERQSNMETLKANIEPDIIKQKYPDKKEIINEIFNIICDTVNSNKQYITISGDIKPIKVVKDCLFKLDSSHLEYVIDSLERTTADIRNPKAYILATIYNSYHTYNNAMGFSFNHDFKDSFFVKE